MEYCRGQQENLEKLAISELDRIIANLQGPIQNAGLLFALIAKGTTVAKSKNEDDYVRFLLYIQDLIPAINLLNLENTYDLCKLIKI